MVVGRRLPSAFEHVLQSLDACPARSNASYSPGTQSLGAVRLATGRGGHRGCAHAEVNDKQPFTTEHFERWLQLFGDTLELGWTGPNTDRALALAANVAAVHSNQLVGRSRAGARP